jgi:predicted MFS family arabinose efflux permease
VVSPSSKIGGIVFGLYFAFCGLVALLVALRDRRPAGLGRILLISAAVVHGLLGAFAWGLMGWPEFLFMVVVLALIVLLLMTYDGQEAPAATEPRDSAPQDGPDTSGSPLTGPPAPTTP